MRSVKLYQQNPPVLNWRCRLTQIDLYNGHKTVVVVTVLTFKYRRSAGSSITLGDKITLVRQSITILWAVTNCNNTCRKNNLSLIHCYTTVTAEVVHPNVCQMVQTMYSNVMPCSKHANNQNPTTHQRNTECQVAHEQFCRYLARWLNSDKPFRM